MNEFFGIRYEFDKQVVWRTIDYLINIHAKGYICVADGVVLSHANTNPQYTPVLNASIFSVCDSNWVPLYLRLIYGKRYNAYCGSELFRDIIAKRKYNMVFVGGSEEILNNLRQNMAAFDRQILHMKFLSLPFNEVADFHYNAIAEEINNASPDIIWVALGAPKQELFMNRLIPHIDRGVLIGVGAVFNFFSGIESRKRAPAWMINSRLEWFYRVIKEPRKQLFRVFKIVQTTPGILIREIRK